MFRSVLFVLMGLLVCGPVAAAEEEKSATLMGEVVVTATRQAEALDKVPANVTVITEEEIERSAAETVPELLKSVSGIVVTDITGNGRSYSVDLRGFGESDKLNTLVLVDGRRINQVDQSAVDWLLIPKDRVERIEIVRGGSGSTLYGDNASGGVINIITKKEIETTSGEVRLLSASYDTFRGNASVASRLDDLSIALNSNYRESDGYRDNSDNKAKDIGANLNYDATDKLSLRFNGGYHKDDTGLPGPLLKSDLDSGVSRTTASSPNDYAKIKDWYLQGGAQYFLTDNSYFDVDISLRKRLSETFFVDFGGYGRSEIETISLSPQFVLRESLLGHPSNIVFGIDYVESSNDIIDDWGLPDNYEISKEGLGYFVHSEIDLSDALTFSAGFRKERASFEYEYKSIESPSFDSNVIDKDLFTAGTTYKISDELSGYVSYAKSFRFPVIDEFYDRFSKSLVTDLGAQKSDNFELGLRINSNDFRANVSFFHIVTENEIFYELNVANKNLDGDTIRQGIELAFSKVVCETLISGGYTFRNIEIDGGSFDGKDFPGVPRHQLNLGAQKTLNDLIQLNLNGNYIGKRRFISDFDNTLGYQNDYLYVTGKISYLLDNGSIYIAVNNLLNEDFSEFGVEHWSGEEAFYPSPKINFIFGANFRF